MLFGKRNNKIKGDRGEKMAEDFLKGKGYRLLERQFRTRFGEIDLIMQQGNTVVFVEVKTRTSHRFGLPEEAVTAQKKSHMFKAAETWLTSRDMIEETDCRFDVVAITLSDDGTAQRLEHFENIEV